jgi:hypothetical protein
VYVGKRFHVLLARFKTASEAQAYAGRFVAWCEMRQGPQIPQITQIRAEKGKGLPLGTAVDEQDDPHPALSLKGEG